jgi:hypothetical protein
VLIEASRSLEMTDRASISAGQQVNVKAGRDVLLTQIQAGQQVEIMAGAAILDNTPSSEDDLVITDTLTLHAVNGIGQRGLNNLNVSANTLSARNTGSVGIYIHNHRGYNVGKLGIANTGSGDLVLGSNGVIHYKAVAFKNEAQGEGVISNRPGQKVSVASNLIPGGMEFSWTSGQKPLSSLMPIPQPHSLANLFNSEEKLGGDQYAEMRDQWQKENDLSLARPILLADGWQVEGAKSVLETLGLSGAEWSEQMPLQDSWMPQIELLRQAGEINGARLDGHQRFDNEGSQPVEGRDSLQMLQTFAEESLDESLFSFNGMDIA